MSSVKTDAISYPAGIVRLPNCLSSASGACWEGSGEDTAGGVACGGMEASPRTCFVDWTHMNVLMKKHCTFSSFQLSDGLHAIEDLGE